MNSLSNLSTENERVGQMSLQYIYIYIGTVRTQQNYKFGTFHFLEAGWGRSKVYARVYDACFPVQTAH